MADSYSTIIGVESGGGEPGTASTDLDSQSENGTIQLEESQDFELESLLALPDQKTSRVDGGAV